MPIVYLPDKNVEIKFDDDMTREQMQEAIMQKFYKPVDPHIADLTPQAGIPLQAAQNQAIVSSNRQEPSTPIQNGQNNGIESPPAMPDSVAVPFDETASINAKTAPETQNTPQAPSLPFDETGFQPKQTAGQLLKNGVDALYTGAKQEAVNFNKFIGLGATDATRKLFIDQPQEQINKSRAENQPSTWVGKQARTFLEGVGALPIEIAEATAMGVATKLATAGTALEQFLADVPNFVVGSGVKGATEQYEKEPGFKGIPKAIVKGAEDATIARLYTGDAAALQKKATEGVLKSLGKDMGKFTAIGLGDVVYQKAKEGKLPTSDELSTAGTQSIAMALAFAAVPSLEKMTNDKYSKQAYHKLDSIFDEAMRDKDVSKAVDAINQFVNDPKVGIKEKEELIIVMNLADKAAAAENGKPAVPAGAEKNQPLRGTTAMASSGDFADIPKEEPPSEGKQKKQVGENGLPPIKGLSHSDIQTLARALMQGKHPAIREKIARHADNVNGIFYPNSGKVVLRADLFKDEDQANKTLSHEIFHVIDHLDDKTLKRGNILGHIAALKKYMKHLLPESPDPDAPPILTSKDRARLRKEAAKQVRKFNPEEAVKLPGRKVTAQDILDIWRKNVEDVDPKLLDYVKTLSDQERVNITKQAMKGLTPDEFRDFEITEKPEKPTVKAKYRELLNAEIKKRRLFELDKVRDELIKFTHKWKPFDADADPEYTKYRYQPAELYADAGSALLTNPEYLKKEAPLYYKAFMNYLDARPTVKKAYINVLKMANKTPEEQTRDRVEREIQMFKEGTKKRMAAIKANKREPRGVKDFLMTGLWDAAHDALKVIREGERRPGDVKENAEKARMALQEMQHLSSVTGVYLSDYKEAVVDELKKRGLDINELGVVGFNKRIAEGDRADKANPITNKSLAEQDLSILGEKIWGKEKFEQYKDILKKFREINEQDIYPTLEKSALFPKKLMDYIKENTNHLKWDVTEYFDKALGTHGKGTAHIYKQYGTMADVDNPVLATVMQNISLQRAALINITKQELMQTLRDAWAVKPAEMKFLDGRVRPVEPDRNTGLGILTVFEKNEPGKPHYYYVDKGIADLFKYAPEQAIHLYNLWSAASQITKELIVGKNPAWMARNLFLRDISATATNLPGLRVRDLPKLVKAYIDTLPDVKDEAFYRKSSDRIRNMKLNRGLPQYRLWTSDKANYENEIERQLVEFKVIPEVDSAAKYVPEKVREAYDAMEKLGYASELWSKVAADKFLEDRDRPITNKIRKRIKNIEKATEKLRQKEQDLPEEEEQTDKDKAKRASLERRIKILDKKKQAQQDRLDLLTRKRAQITRELAGTPDAKQHSKWHRMMDSAFLFSEMGKAGIRQGITAFKMDKSGYVWRTAVFNVLPHVIEHVVLANGAMVGVQLVNHLLHNSKDEKLKAYVTRLIKERGKAYDLVSDWDKEHYQVFPLGITDDGKAAYLRIPLNYEGQVFGMLGQITAKEIMKQLQGNGADLAEAYKGLLDVGKVEMPYNLHPFLSALHHIAEYLSGENIENWKGYKIIPQRVMNLGGADYIKASYPYILKQLWNDVGLGSLYDFQQADMNRTKKWYRKALNTWGLNALGTYLRFSDRGETERIRREWELMRQQKAKGTYEAHQIVEKITRGEYKDKQDIVKALLTPGVTRRKIIKELGLRSDNRYIRLLTKAHNDQEKMVVIRYMLKNLADRKKQQEVKNK